MPLEDIMNKCNRPASVADMIDIRNKMSVVQLNVSFILFKQLIYDQTSQPHMIQHKFKRKMHMLIDGMTCMFKCHVHRCTWLSVKILISASRNVLYRSRETEDQCGQPFVMHSER